MKARKQLRNGKISGYVKVSPMISAGESD